MKRLVYGFLLLLLPGFIQAQDTTPWPPDPAAIFAPGVQVVSVEEIHTEVDADPYVDTQAKELLIFDSQAGKWNEYAYPQEFEKYHFSSLRDYGQSDFIITFSAAYDDFNIGETFYSVIFDTTRKQFISPQSVCGHFVRDPVGEGKWRFYLNPADEKTYLCFTEDGELKGPLPDGYYWLSGLDDFPNSPSVSPDGKWVVFFGAKGDGFTGGDFDLYSYELETGTLNSLGTLQKLHYPDPGYSVGFSDWVDNGNGSLYISPSREYLTTGYYAFDVTKPNSIQHISNGWAYEGWPISKNHELIFFNSEYLLNRVTGSASPEGAYRSCHLTIYDSEGIQDYELGTDCITIPTGDFGCGDIVVRDDNFLFLQADSEDDPYTTLSSFNLTTRKRIDLMKGEFKRILSVSPDGRFVVLANGHDGVVDRPSCDTTGYNPENTTIVIIDTQSLFFVYQSEGIGPVQNNVIWLSNDEVLLYMKEFFTPAFRNDATSVVSITARNALYWVKLNSPYSPLVRARYDIVAEPEFVSGSRYTIAQIPDGNGYKSIDFQTGNDFDILKPKAQAVYNMTLAPGEDDLIIATVHSDDGQILQYTIRLP